MVRRRKSQPTPPPPGPSPAAPDPFGRDAVAELYACFADRIYAYALQRLRDPEFAADITSTVFTRALANRSSFHGPDPGGPSTSAVEGWLLTIARNAIIDHVRANRRLTILDVETYRERLADHAADPANAAVAPDEREQLLRALHQLNSPMQRIVLLRLQGWNGVEIAELLGMSHGAVRTAQHRAYARLREILTEDSATSTACVLEPDHV